MRPIETVGNSHNEKLRGRERMDVDGGGSTSKMEIVPSHSARYFRYLTRNY
jgi:hypothetical protein